MATNQNQSSENREKRVKSRKIRVSKIVRFSHPLLAEQPERLKNQVFRLFEFPNKSKKTTYFKKGKASLIFACILIYLLYNVK